MNRVLKNAVSFFFVNKCAGCGKLLEYDSEEALCLDCLEKWNEEKNKRCPDCKQKQTECRCGFEGCSADSVRHLASYSAYEESVAKKLVFDLKNENDSQVINFVAREMANELCDVFKTDGTVVVNAPRNPKTIREKGYDHSKKTAKALAAFLNADYVDALKQIESKVDQKKLDRQKRTEHAKKTIEYRKRAAGLVKGKNVLLVDDVGTTGSTVSACVNLLKENGAGSVDCLLLARVDLFAGKSNKTVDKSEK